MSRSKTFRRHHRARLLKKYYDRLRLVNYRHASDKGERDNVERMYQLAAVRVTTPALCSCHMCGNPRKFRGNSQIGLTMHELRHRDWEREEY